MNSFRAIGTFIITFFDTITMASISLNHLARAGVERTVVVEEKSRAAAALSAYENKSNVALRLEEIKGLHESVTPESIAEADEFLKEYDKSRNKDITTQPVRTQRAAATKRGRKKNS